MHRILALRAKLRTDPSDLSVAVAYWDALSNVDGQDRRSAFALMECLGRHAISSPQGAYHFARAYLELETISGDTPLLTAEVREGLSAAIRHLALSEAAVVEQLLSPGGMPVRDDV